MIDLTQYGFPVELLNDKDVMPARVTAVHRGACEMVCPQGIVRAQLRGTALRESEERGMYPATGDYAYIQYNPSGDSQIIKLLDRKSKFARNNFMGHLAQYAKSIMEQVVAANFEYVLITASLNYDFNTRRIERYLALARQSGGAPIIVLTKADLVDGWEAQQNKIYEIAPDVPTYVVSAKTGLGMKELGVLLAPGKTFVLLGSSGVGKSSLVNALEGEEIMAVKEIREDDSRGRHTTTHRQLLLLKSGAIMIDTPGMREMGMWDAGDGLAETFADVHALIHSCRFSNCTHGSEPGCAVQRALSDGGLPKERWRSYMQLTGEQSFVARKAARIGAPRKAKRALAGQQPREADDV